MSLQKIRDSLDHGAARRRLKLFTALGLVAGLSFSALVIYVSLHFIIKYW